MRRFFFTWILCMTMFWGGQLFQEYAVPYFFPKPAPVVLNIGLADLATESMPEPTRIIFRLGNGEWLSIGPDAFYVRGQKVEQDANEGRAVYEALLQFVMILNVPNKR